MLELLALNPDARLRKEIDAVEMIPMHVRDDDVRDVLRLHPARATASLGGMKSGRLPARDQAVAMKPGVDEHVAAVGTLEQPDHHRDVEAPARIGAGDEARTRESRDRRVANRVDLVRRRRRTRERPTAMPNASSAVNTSAASSREILGGDQSFVNASSHRVDGRGQGSLFRTGALYESTDFFVECVRAARGRAPS